MSSSAISSMRRLVAQHPVYGMVNSLPRLQLFMQNHVFAVLDFMSLTQALKESLSPTTQTLHPRGDFESYPVHNIIWSPPEWPELHESRRFLEEIWRGEAYDQMEIQGTLYTLSHLELYWKAMTEVGADPQVSQKFLRASKKFTHNGYTSIQALQWLRHNRGPEPASQFLEETILVVMSPTCFRDEKLIRQLAYFMAGRETLVPEMFERLLAQEIVTEAPFFEAYLARHIEVDGEDHGPKSEAMSRDILRVLADDEDPRFQKKQQEWWEEYQVRALYQRLQLWDGIALQMTVEDRAIRSNEEYQQLCQYMYHSYQVLRQQDPKMWREFSDQRQELYGRMGVL